MSNRLNFWTAKFDSQQIEEAYQARIAEGDRQSNIRVLAYALPIFPLYALLDYVTIAEPAGAIVTRLAISFMCFVLFVVMLRPKFAAQSEIYTMIITILLGCAVNIINFKFATLSDAYYVGLIQGCVFICFLLRVSFLKAMIVQGSYLLLFIPAAQLKPDLTAANLQTVVMLTMVIVCGIGANLLQRFRRYDFLKALIIERQNEQLNSLLTDAKIENERKLAAMNMLVHFVKTPLHQINGFSDILVNANADASKDELSQYLDSAKYIKTATADLTRSVNRLLAYHRLDDLDGNLELETVEPDYLVEEFTEAANSDFEVASSGAASAVLNSKAALKTAVISLGEFYKDEENKLERVTVEVIEKDGRIEIVFEDDAPPLSAEDFSDKTKPLTKIDNYLTIDGAKMPMLLRTVARAVEITGGDFTHKPLPSGNRFTISIPDCANTAVAA